MKVYLSGRMSGLPREVWWNRFRLAQYELEAKHGNVQVVNPAETFITNMPWLYRLIGYKWTLWYALRLLRRCTHIYMIGDDWQQSRGARLERLKARQWGIVEMKPAPQEPAWIRNARFDILEYLRQRAQLKKRKVECPQTEFEPVPRDEMGNALIEFLNIKPTENE